MATAASGIPERRLRPLWDAIDSRQHKPALKLASSLLAKHPDSVYLLVLKALVLERIGKPDEALVLCHRAKDTEPTDDLTLSTLQIVYQRLGHLTDATICYERACNKMSNNLDLMMALFSCYVREYNYVKQQQVAMKMYKIAGEERFLMWAICSTYLQVVSGDGIGKKLLPLAEALLKKRIDSNGLKDLEALLVYISLLQEQGKHQSALDVLTVNQGLFAVTIDRLRLQGKLLMHLQEFQKAREVYKEILRMSRDDWEAMVLLIDATLEVFSEENLSSLIMEQTLTTAEKKVQRVKQRLPICLTAEEADLRLKELEAFVGELQEMEANNLERGPFLATLEIKKHQFLLKVDVGGGNLDFEACSKPLAESVLHYFKRFGHLTSFSSDVLEYLLLLKNSQSNWAVESLSKACNDMVDDNKMKVLRRKITVFQVEEQLCLKAASLEKDILPHIDEHIKLFMECLPYCTDVDTSESVLGEELLIISANMLIEVFCRSKNIAYILLAIFVLQLGLSIRGFNFQYKILLIHIYSTLCCTSLALNFYKTLEVKNILLETLPHHVLHDVLNSTNFSEIESVLKGSIKFHEDYQNEAADLIIAAYRHCNYTKVLEFVAFKDRLQNSYHLLFSKIEDVILSLKQKSNSVEDFEAVLASLDFGLQSIEWCSEKNLSSLSFNEDLQTRPWWSPVPGVNYLTDCGRNVADALSDKALLQVEKRKTKCRTGLQKRCLVPRLLFLSLNAVAVPNNTGPGTNGSLFQELHDRLLVYLKAFNLSWMQVEGFLQERRSLDIVKEAGEDVDYMLYVGLLWVAGNLSQAFLTTGCDIDPLIRAIATLENLLENCFAKLMMSITHVMGLVVNGRYLYSLVKVLSEPIAWLGLCIQAWSKRFHALLKRKKKGNTHNEHTDDHTVLRILDCFRKLAAHVCSQLEKLDAFLVLLQRTGKDEIQLLSSVFSTNSSENDASAVQVLRVLETCALPGKIPLLFAEGLHNWKLEAHLKSVLGSQHQFVSQVQDMCKMRLRFYSSIKI